MTRLPVIWLLKILAIIAISTSISHPVRCSEQPKIHSILPNSAITSPGTKVKIMGTGFLPGATIYFDGLQARRTNFVSPAELEVETPYLRPGSHLLQVATVAGTSRSDVEFLALPSEADSQIDRAIELAQQGRADDAISALEQIGKTDSDYQVRAAAYYLESQISFNRGDFSNWRRASALIYLDSDKSGMAVQTYWRYRLALARSLYLLDEEPKGKFITLADQLINFDVTQNAEPRFYRALMNARAGNLAKAQVDSDFVTKSWPNNPSATALAAYIAALGGDTAPIRAMTSGPTPTDATALALLGEALFVCGDSATANKFWALSGEANPASATMACLAAKKHLANGQKMTARILFSECAATASTSKIAQEAREALSHLEE